MNILIYNKITGEILRSMSIPAGSASLQCKESEDWIDHALVDDSKFYIDSITKQLIPIPDRPSNIYKFDFILKQWVDPRTFAEIKSQQLNNLKQQRDQAINSTFTYDGSEFDSDQVSQTRILGLYISSKEPTFTPTMWRLADNSWRELNAQDVQNVWEALQAHIRAQFQHFAQKEALLNAATTKEEVEAITW